MSFSGWNVRGFSWSWSTVKSSAKTCNNPLSIMAQKRFVFQLQTCKRIIKKNFRLCELAQRPPQMFLCCHWPTSHNSAAPITKHCQQMSKACRGFLSFLPPQGVIKLINRSDMTHITTQLINSSKFTHFPTPTQKIHTSVKFAKINRPSQSCCSTKIVLKIQKLSIIVRFPRNSWKWKNIFHAIEKSWNSFLKRFQSDCQSWITTSSGHGFQLKISARLTNFEREMFYATSQNLKQTANVRTMFNKRESQESKNAFRGWLAGNRRSGSAAVATFDFFGTRCWCANLIITDEVSGLMEVVVFFLSRKSYLRHHHVRIKFLTDCVSQ